MALDPELGLSSAPAKSGCKDRERTQHGHTDKGETAAELKHDDTPLIIGSKTKSSFSIAYRGLAAKPRGTPARR